MKKLEILTLRQYLSVNTQECHSQRQKFVFAKYPDVKILPIEPELPRDRDFLGSLGFKIPKIWTALNFTKKKIPSFEFLLSTVVSAKLHRYVSSKNDAVWQSGDTV